MSDENDLEAVGNILKHIKKKWDEDKENWQVMGGIDKHGNHDLLITQEPHTWWIKSKPIDPYRSISFGKHLTNLDLDLKDIDAEIKARTSGGKNVNPIDVMHTLFGIAAPTDREILAAMGVQRVSRSEMNIIKKRVDEKYPNLEKKISGTIKKTWRKEFSDRDAMFV